MSQILNLELSDATFAAIQQQAQLSGMSPADLAVEILEKQVCLSPLSEEEKQKRDYALKIILVKLILAI